MLKFMPILALIMLLFACKKEGLKGIDQNALFAPPSTEELLDIEMGWKKKNLVPTELAIESSTQVNSSLKLDMISYMLNGEKQYAAVLLPERTERLPIQIFISGFGLERPVSDLSIATDPIQPLPFICVLPALKGQSLNLTVNGTIYNSPISQGTRNDAFDGAADDGIAALNAVIATYAQNTDPTRIAARGGSRGATVAMLMGIRDPRIKKVIAVAGPTELIEATKEHQNDPTYRFQFLDGLISKTENFAQARSRLIASSPLYFCQYLPKTQLHLGETDQIVPVRNGELLQQAMETKGVQGNLERYIYPGRGHNNIASGNEEMEQRIKVFLQDL